MCCASNEAGCTSGMGLATGRRHARQASSLFAVVCGQSVVCSEWRALTPVSSVGQHQTGRGRGRHALGQTRHDAERAREDIFTLPLPCLCVASVLQCCGVMLPYPPASLRLPRLCSPHPFHHPPVATVSAQPLPPALPACRSTVSKGPVRVVEGRRTGAGWWQAKCMAMAVVQVQKGQ